MGDEKGDMKRGHERGGERREGNRGKKGRLKETKDEGETNVRGWKMEENGG